MNKFLDTQEILIVIVAENLNPSVVNPDFLKYSGVIPSSWELAKAPVISNSVSQLNFTNGISIVGQPNRVIFAESRGTKSLADLGIAELAYQYVEKLPKVEYQAVGISPRGWVQFESEAAAYLYLTQNLLTPGSWQEFGTGRMNAGLQLSYPLNRGQLNLGINQVNLNFGEQSVPAILFSGNFDYPLIGNTQSERLQDLQKIIQNWQVDLEVYEELINTKFFQPIDQPVRIA